MVQKSENKLVLYLNKNDKAKYNRFRVSHPGCNISKYVQEKLIELYKAENFEQDQFNDTEPIFKAGNKDEPNQAS